MTNEAKIIEAVQFILLCDAPDAAVRRAAYRYTYHLGNPCTPEVGARVNRAMADLAHSKWDAVPADADEDQFPVLSLQERADAAGMIAVKCPELDYGFGIVLRALMDATWDDLGFLEGDDATERVNLIRAWLPSTEVAFPARVSA